MRFTVLLRVEDSGSWPVLLKGDERPEGDENSLASRDECVIFKICSVCKKDTTRVFTAHSRGPEA